MPDHFSIGTQRHSRLLVYHADPQAVHFSSVILVVSDLALRIEFRSMIELAALQVATRWLQT